MPRVNRDLQRRMAARRERERRRPAERRYEFGPRDQAAAAPEDALVDGAPHEAEVLEPDVDEAPAVTPAPLARPTRPARAGATARAARASVARPAPRTFAEYREEYRYVVGDLRRIVVVIGSLLVLLIVLAFVLPR